jgi:hypothetical protein
LENEVQKLLKDLADAKLWPEKFESETMNRENIDQKIEASNKKIMEMEKQARQFIKKYGCTDLKSRLIYQGMADMLINWYAFIDSLTA